MEWIGIVGYALVALGMIQHSDIRVKSFIIAACFVNSLYFLALGMWISAAVVVLTAFRIGVSMKFRHPVVAVPFVLLSALLPFCLPSGDVLAAIAGVIGAVAVFWAKGLWLKRILLLASATWILNNALSGAWIGVAGESFVFVLGLRFLWIQRQSESQAPCPRF
jgi:hypothetical protein